MSHESRPQPTPAPPQPPEPASAAASKPSSQDATPTDPLTGLRYVQYEVQKESTYLSPIRAIISKDLSEPYSIYVYRYFLNQWPQLCFMVL